jgi:hypothetical protein
MPARITIQSGVAAGTSHRINSRVARVGSDPQSDVCLPSADIPAHALTLEFQDSPELQDASCLVYNRCRSRIYVGAQVVEPDQSVHWPETDILQMDQGIELLLDFDDSNGTGTWANDESEYADGMDDSSTAEPISGLEGSQENWNAANTVRTGSTIKTGSTATPESTAKPGSTTKTVVQLCVTGLCLAGCALLLLREQNRAANVDVGVGFAEVVSMGLDDATVPRSLINRLQYAEAQRVRGRAKVADEQFQSIRDELVFEAPDPLSTRSKMLQFVQTRLASGS